MADDWQPGDLALCVRGGWLSGLRRGPYPQAGAIYTVEAIQPWGSFGTWLRVKGAPDNVDDRRNWGPLWDACRFRKIKPLSDTEREEALRNLKAPVREPVQ